MAPEHTVGSPLVYHTGTGTLTITVAGPAGSRVDAYDSLATPDRLDTLLISGPSSSGVTVTVTESSSSHFDLGRVITTDNTQLASFTFNGDILGDVNGGPSLWIDSDVTTFTARNLPNDATWNGVIGGNVSKLTLNQLGPGRLRVGGRIATLTITTSRRQSVASADRQRHDLGHHPTRIRFVHWECFCGQRNQSAWRQYGQRRESPLPCHLRR